MAPSGILLFTSLTIPDGLVVLMYENCGKISFTLHPLYTCGYLFTSSSHPVRSWHLPSMVIFSNWEPSLTLVTQDTVMLMWLHTKPSSTGARSSIGILIILRYKRGSLNIIVFIQYYYKRKNRSKNDCLGDVNFGCFLIIIQPFTENVTWAVNRDSTAMYVRTCDSSSWWCGTRGRRNGGNARIVRIVEK